MTIGSFAQQAIDDAFFLNAAGSRFVKAAHGTVNAFEVYANNVVASNASQLQIILDEIAEEGSSSQRGDVNKDGAVNIADVTALIDHLLSGDTSLIDLTAADCLVDGAINIADVTALIDYLLIGAW